jgi:hypothetical protein
MAVAASDSLSLESDERLSEHSQRYSYGCNTGRPITGYISRSNEKQ